jgi:hypothetical protein
MGNQRTPGLQKRNGVWHVDKKFRGARICESTGTSDILQAKEYFAKRVMEMREARLFGARQERTFRVAATKYLEENQHKRSLERDARALAILDPGLPSKEPEFYVNGPQMHRNQGTNPVDSFCIFNNLPRGARCNWHH